jgi:flagellar biosynthetic protein FliR
MNTVLAPFSTYLSAGLVFPFLLVLVRLTAALMVFPVLSDPSINARARFLTALAVSFILFPLLKPMLPQLPALTSDMFLFLFGEIITGILLGLGARLMMAAMSVAGELISFVAGFQAASLFDPSSGTNTGAPGVFLTLCAGMVILGLNLHHQLIEAIVQSYGTFPPGHLPDVGDVSAAVVELVVELTKLGVQLAAPVVVTGLLSNALFGVLNRLIPQLQVFFVSVPVSVTLSILVLTASLGTMLELWGSATQDRLTVFNVQQV